MQQLIKPKALKIGDTIATISLSWGGAHIFPERYHQGKKQIQEAFGVNIVETKHALSSPQELYQHPEWRLEDLMWAFQNPDIKAILCNIGGDDTIRLLQLMTNEHFNVIKNNPKIFMGMSDTTVNHFMCLKAGLGSFYTPVTLFGYAENGGIPDFIIQNTRKTLFDARPVGTLLESTEIILDRIDWEKGNVIRPRTPATPWRYIQGDNPVSGKLIGGCFDVLDFINGTSLWPKLLEWENTILFLENSEEMPSPERILYWLRNFGAQGILEKINGILFARPGGEFNPSELDKKNKWCAQSERFDEMLLKVCVEYGCSHIPIVTNMNFGHIVPQLILPYGIMTEINPLAQTVSVLESSVI